jgi:hypothetical protein
MQGAAAVVPDVLATVVQHVLMLMKPWKIHKQR